MSSMRGRLWVSAWVMLALFVCLTTASRRGKRDDDDDDDDDHDDDDKDEKKTFWDHVGGIIVLGVLSLIGAGLFSLAAWIFCSCHSKCTKRRVCHSAQMTVRPGKLPSNSLPPEWSRMLKIQPELTTGFGMMSEGFFSMTNVNVLRQRPGPDVTDGARWAAPLTTGKHLFEIIWPWGCRGYHSTVGVVTDKAPIKEKGGVRLVGGNAHSWGIDIVQRRAIHNNQTLHACPTDGSYVPDRFLMYVDVDEGTLGFGNEVTFWGNVITNLPRGKPLFPMIGTNKYEANVQLIYRGSAGTSGFDMFTGGASGFDPNSTPASSYTLPPLTGPLPPKYSEVYHIPLGETGTDNPPDFKPREAWEMTPPPPSAPADSPPPYTSPTPQY